MSARSAASPLVRRSSTRCACVCATFPRAAELDADLRLLGSVGCPEKLNLNAISRKYGIAHNVLSIHRRGHLGLPLLPRGRPREGPPPPEPSPEVKVRREAYRAPVRAKPESPPQYPRTLESVHAQLVKTIATLISLGSYRGLPTAQALAARHNVPVEEVLRAHKRAALSVRDGRGGIREQIELSLGVLTQMRDSERKVADDYTGIADRIVAASLPNAQTGATRQRQASQDELDRARAARSIAAQAVDNAVACQKQIDQNTIHRRTAPLVQVSFNASPDFTKALDGWIELVEALAGHVVEGIRDKIERGLTVLEDCGERLDAPEWVEYLAEIRRDREAVVVEGETYASHDPAGG